MELEASHKKILEYLLKHSPANTFRLSRHLGIDRHELIAIIKDLTKKRLVEFKHGSVSINENRYQKLAGNKEEKPAGLPKPLAVPEILNKPELKREEKSEKGIDSYIKELEEKPSEKEPKTIKEELKKIPVKRKPQKAIVKSRIAKKKKEPKKARIKKKPEKKKRHKKVKVKKEAKKVRTRKVLGKEKQEALNQWSRIINLDIEKLKIEIKLLSLSPNSEKIRRLRASIVKLRNMIDLRMREK